MSDLFAGTYARAGAVDGTTWLAALLEVEGALARANAAEGLIDEDAAHRVVEACAVEGWDVAALADQAAPHASVVVPLAAELRERAGDGAHVGATSQDILDTAAMVIAHRVRDDIVADARRAVDLAAALAERHRDTRIAARTLLQQALPTSFGLVAAGWALGLHHAARALAKLHLPVQMGGPVGTRDPAVADRLATALGLDHQTVPWSADRTPVARLGGGLAVVTGACGKIARDVALLSQTEVGELREAAPGGSSAMPHKRNPVASVSVLACAARTPGLAATLTAGLTGELHRSAGAWQAEWGTVSDLLTLTASAASWTAALLAALEVDADRMAADAPDGDLGASATLIDRALEELR